jgi:hypothetical protein
MSDDKPLFRMSRTEVQARLDEATTKLESSAADVIKTLTLIRTLAASKPIRERQLRGAEERIDSFIDSIKDQVSDLKKCAKEKLTLEHCLVKDF